jgi:hypothetical protein
MTLFALAFEKASRLRGAALTDPWVRIKLLEDVISDLQRDFGTWAVAWGEINRLQRTQSGGDEPFSDANLSLPISGAPGWLGIVYNFYTRPEKGQKRRYGIAGHSFVSVVRTEVRARSSCIQRQCRHKVATALTWHCSTRASVQARFTLDEIRHIAGSIIRVRNGDRADQTSLNPGDVNTTGTVGMVCKTHRRSSRQRIFERSFKLFVPLPISQVLCRYAWRIKYIFLTHATEESLTQSIPPRVYVTAPGWAQGL